MARAVLTLDIVKRLAVLVTALTLPFAVAAPAAAPAAQPTAAPFTVAHACKGSRYRHAIVEGKHKCLGTGQFCAIRHQRIYRRHGFVCKRGSDGRLRLHRR
jgi:hypothetical protein